MSFQGINQLEIAAGGCLKLLWLAVDGVNKYNIYIRPDNSDIFQEEYLLGKFSNTLTEAKIRTEADLNTLLQDTKMYYVGVRAEDMNGDEDANEVVLYARPLGTGQVFVFVNDRHISLVS